MALKSVELCGLVVILARILTPAYAASDWGAISCVGKSNQHLQVQPDFDPNTKTMQHLCAKTAYGGGPAGQHIGGFCARAPVERWIDVTGQVAFDQHETNQQLANPRLFSECLNRCWCAKASRSADEGLIFAPRDLEQMPKFISPNPGFAMIYLRFARRASSQTYQVTIDANQDYDVPTAQHMGTSGDLPVENIRFFGNDVEQSDFGNSGPLTSVSVDQSNCITCDGPMPAWPLPAPWSIEEFGFNAPQGRLAAMCAVYQSGGYRSTNAGGYCYHGERGTEVAFSDEMTPRLDWTWGGNLLYSAAIRYHCWKYCLCSNPQNGTLSNGTNVRPYSTYKIWDLLDTAARHVGIYSTSNGSVQFQGTGSSGQSSSIQILPDQSSSNPPSGTCGPDGRQFCKATWPSDVAGPPPVAPPLIPTLQYNASNSVVGHCGVSKTCSTSSGCSPDDDTCKCMIPDSKTAQEYGVDPIFPPSLCLTIATFSVHTSKTGGKRNLKSHEFPLNGDGEPWKCVCNSTYASPACCMSNDGLVWEESK